MAPAGTTRMHQHRHSQSDDRTKAVAAATPVPSKRTSKVSTARKSPAAVAVAEIADDSSGSSSSEDEGSLSRTGLPARTGIDTGDGSRTPTRFSHVAPETRSNAQAALGQDERSEMSSSSSSSSNRRSSRSGKNSSTIAQPKRQSLLIEKSTAIVSISAPLLLPPSSHSAPSTPRFAPGAGATDLLSRAQHLSSIGAADRNSKQHLHLHSQGAAAAGHATAAGPGLDINKEQQHLQRRSQEASSVLDCSTLSRRSSSPAATATATADPRAPSAIPGSGTGTGTGVGLGLGLDTVASGVSSAAAAADSARASASLSLLLPPTAYPFSASSSSTSAAAAAASPSTPIASAIITTDTALLRRGSASSSTSSASSGSYSSAVLRRPSARSTPDPQRPSTAASAAAAANPPPPGSSTSLPRRPLPCVRLPEGPDVCTHTDCHHRDSGCSLDSALSQRTSSVVPAASSTSSFSVPDDFDLSFDLRPGDCASSHHHLLAVAAAQAPAAAVVVAAAAAASDPLRSSSSSSSRRSSSAIAVAASASFADDDEHSSTALASSLAAPIKPSLLPAAIAFVTPQNPAASAARSGVSFHSKPQAFRAPLVSPISPSSSPAVASRPITSKGGIASIASIAKDTLLGRKKSTLLRRARPDVAVASSTAAAVVAAPPRLSPSQPQVTHEVSLSKDSPHILGTLQLTGLTTGEESDIWYGDHRFVLSGVQITAGGPGATEGIGAVNALSGVENSSAASTAVTTPAESPSASALVPGESDQISDVASDAVTVTSQESPTLPAQLFGQSVNKMHQTSSRLLRTTQNDRPFTRDFNDLFSTLMVSLPLTTHRVRFRSVEFSFTSEEAINNLGALKFSQSNRMPDPKDPTRIVTTTTTTTFSMAREMARSVCQRFLDARFIESTDQKPVANFPLKHALWQLTPKGINILERFCQRNGINQVHVMNLLRSPRNTMQLVILERDLATDELSHDRSTIEVIFRRFIGIDGPNIKQSISQADSDSLSDYCTGIIGVKMSAERKIGDRVVYNTFTGKAGADWLLDCCATVERRECLEIATQFILCNLIECVSVDKGLAATARLREYQPVKQSIYRLTERGQVVAGWLPADAIPGSSSSSSRPSRNELSHARPQRETNTNRLTIIVKDPALRLLFREYLRETHCEENLSFYLDVVEFLQNFKGMRKHNGVPRPDTVRETLAAAYGLYNAFLAPGSPCELNIDHSLRNSLASRMTRAVGDDAGMLSSLNEVAALFEQAQHQVFKLMATDSVPKFLKEPKYTPILREHDFDLPGIKHEDWSAKYIPHHMREDRPGRPSASDR